jgi:gliding motility-associated-like protein
MLRIFTQNTPRDTQTKNNKSVFIGLTDLRSHFFTTTAQDRSCIGSHKADTSVTLYLEDIDTGIQNILPANLLTVNGDGLNDCFYLKNLPDDNCTYEFRSVQVFNRWGARIFMSSDRNFRWCPESLSDGVYYYSIDLKDKIIKSWIQIIR